MSANGDEIEKRPYSPAKPTKLTIADIQALKELIEETPLKWWIIAAGIGGALQGLYILWLFAKFLLNKALKS